MNPKLQRIKYLVSDFMAGAASWFLFYLFRKIFIESAKFGYKIQFHPDTKFWTSIIVLPLFWLTIHYLSGYYRDPCRKSRLKELGKTLGATFTGSLIVFFALILNDTIVSYKTYYISFLALFSIQFFLTYLPRVIITSVTTSKIRKGKIGFNTILVGSNGKALKIYNQLSTLRKSAGYNFVGFITVNKLDSGKLEKHIEKLGELNDLSRIIREKKIKEVIIAIEKEDYQVIGQIINKLNFSDVSIKAIPVLYDILLGRVKISSVFGAPLIEVTHKLIPEWQEVLKRVADIVLSLSALILTFPLDLLLILAIKINSPGSAFYIQERIGRYGKPFKLIKFRSMYRDAEQEGPSLSSANDPRITSVGRFLRKNRLDEIPNFLVVLKGDMSLVGPRPERKFYIDQIMEKAPHYLHLQKVKPGITSWGQVKYGYAENLDQMIERLNYDLIYIENMSLMVDLRIMLYTISTILKGKGK